MSVLENEFQKKLLANLESAGQVCGSLSPQFSRAVIARGAVPAVQDMIHRGRVSDSFTALQEAGRLDLSVEALVTEARFAPLFTDDEVNACFSLLCESDYYGGHLS